MTDPTKYPILRYFAFDHLPAGPLRETSENIETIAQLMAADLPPGPEVSAGLRHLLEAKDCFVRAALDTPAPPVPVPQTPSAPRPRTPADVLNLDQGWELVTPYRDLPTGKLIRVQPDALDSFVDVGWRTEGDGVLVSVPVDGHTTENSRYPRLYLREWWRGEKAAWSSTKGMHDLVVETQVLAVPPVKPQIVLAEIHDARDDVLQVMYSGLEAPSGDIVVRYRGKQHAVLLGGNMISRKLRIHLTVFDGEITARAETLQGEPLGNQCVVEHSGEGLYFQAGLYLQTNVQKGEKAIDFAVTKLYEVWHNHTGL